jgi:glycosyltransferase involved in cell wall biosynthesis
MNADAPLVSVGVPVYNGGSDIARALETLLAQTHTYLEIIISDNASTDNTGAVCREFAARDPRVIYHRYEKNRGPAANFENVLHRATGAFFMWAAHDDYWHPEFVAANLANLLRDNEVIASVSEVTFVDRGEVRPLRPWVPAGTAPLLGSVGANLRRYVRNPGMNTRFYGLFRRAVLLECVPFDPYSGADWTFVARTLAFGKYAEVPRPLFFRGTRGASSDALRVLRTPDSVVARVLPMWPFTRDVLRMRHARPDLGLWLALGYINLVYAAVLLKSRLHHLLAGRSRQRQ